MQSTEVPSKSRLPLLRAAARNFPSETSPQDPPGVPTGAPAKRVRSRVPPVKFRGKTGRPPSAVLWALLMAALSPASSHAGDWVSWRGPEQNGVSRESGLPESWSQGGLNVVWKAPYGGRSTPIVMGGRVYLLNLAGEGPTLQERLMCLDSETGKLHWEHRFPIFLTDIPPARVGWTSPAGDPETGTVFIHGAQNTFLCIDKDGKVIWERSLHEEFGTIAGYGGRTNTPVVDGDQVVISFDNSSWGSHAKPAHRFLALDKRKGDVLWWSDPAGTPVDTTYSTPVVAVVRGTRLLIGGCADGGIHAIKAGTGEKVWSFLLSKGGINSSVVFWNDLVFASHSEENIDSTVMGRVVAIDATGTGDVTKTHERWRADEIGAGYASPALHDGKLYVVDNSANLFCIDAKSGKVLWRQSLGTVAKGSPILADGKIYVPEVNARFWILEPGEAACSVLNEMKFPSKDGTLIEVNGSPSVAGGRIYFTTRDELYCLGMPQWKGETGAIPPPPAEPAPAPGEPPAHLQIVPADVVLSPGASATFQGRLFNARGQLLRTCRPSWSLKELKAAVSDGGAVAIPADSTFAAGVLEGSAEGLKAEARIRVVPTLPLKVDFEEMAEGKPPPGWISAPSKFAVETLEGQKVLKKISTNLRLVHGETFFGLPSWSGYTIEADVRATEKRRSLPNIGLINCGYSFFLWGNAPSPKVRVVSWVTVPRIDKTLDFPWKPDLWYRMKFKVEVKDGKGFARGKLWPREEPEPEKWTVELEDPAPRSNGSPGLQAYSTGTTARSPGAEVCFDNIQVSPNELESAGTPLLRASPATHHSETPPHDPPLRPGPALRVPAEKFREKTVIEEH
jgi:outer membrane protein assembly factor BamB